MGRPLRVLMVEDSEDDELLLLRALRRGSYEPAAERVETAAAMQAALDGGEWDLVLSDYSMPYFSAPAALALLQESGLDLPFIIVSGAIGEEIAVEAMRVGAHDYVSKDNLARLIPAIERELRDAEVRRERQRAEEALRESERRAREQAHQVQQIIRTVPEGVLLLDTSLRVLLANPAAQEYLAVLADARVGEPLDRLGGRPVAELLAPPPRGLWHEVGVNGSLQPRTFEVIAQPIEAGPEAEGWVLVIRDVTEEREVRRVVQRQEHLDYDHGNYFVSADLTRMQQVVMNLALNARDAMPEGG